MHSTGRTHKPTKARILPVAPTVIEERTRNTNASAIVSTIDAMRIPVVPNKTAPCRALWARSSSAVPGGWKNSEDQRNKIDQNSTPDAGCAHKDKEHKRERMKPQQA